MTTLDSIRLAVLAAQRRFSLDYVAEFQEAPRLDLLAERVRSVLPGIVHVEPVFLHDPRFYRIRMPGAAPAQLEGVSPFDMTGPLRETIGAINVEPDLATDIFPEEPSFRGNDEIRELVEVPRCWVGESVCAPCNPLWALTQMSVQEAWAFSEECRRPARGEGIYIAQPDTGITDHPELADAIDEARWADLLDGGAPLDPLVVDDPMDTPGHGTATGSVIISRETGIVVGTAPSAKLVPIRCIETVIRITQSRVARAIEHAVDSGCHVVSLSLGGLWSRSLAAAVQRAIDQNLIVLAAAGNCVGAVVWPARFSQCIAVAGTNIDDEIWKGSSLGAAVDVAAPGQHVYRATSVGERPVGPGEGTSYAVALTAGVVALWLSHHGREELIRSLAKDERLQHRFSSILRRTANVPPHWDSQKWGAGIVDAAALLKESALMPSVASAEDSGRGTALDAEEAEMAREFILEEHGSTELANLSPNVLQAHGLEIVWLLLERRRRTLQSSDTARPPVASIALRESLRTSNSKLLFP